MRPRSMICKTGVCFVLATVMATLAGCGKAEKAELEQLRQEHAELEKLREENAKLSEAQASNPELVRLRKENEEVHKLRSEVHQLRDEAQQLAKVTEENRKQKAAGNVAAVNQANLGQENERLRAEVAMLRQSIQAAAVPAPNPAAACINNLKQIDGATEQWALENKKPPGTPIAAAELTQISAYINGNRLPSCPQGGNYSIRAVGVPPICSIPGHTL